MSAHQSDANSQPEKTLQRRNFLGAVFVLALATGIVSQFLVHGVSLFLRAAGHSGTMVGLVYLATLPAVLKVIWAPLVDRFGNSRIGHYRSWIIGGQISMTGLLAGLAFADPSSAPVAVIILVMLTAFACATQDTAVAGLMVIKLTPSDRAAGASLRGAGAALAGIFVGLIMALTSEAGGWVATIGVLVAIAGVVATLSFLMMLDRGIRAPSQCLSLRSQFSILRNEAARRLLGIKVLVGMSLALSYGLKSLILIDAGYSVAEAGMIGLVAGGAVGLLAITLVQPLIVRFGGYCILAWLAAISVVFCSVFSVVMFGGFDRVIAAVFVLIANAITFAMFPASRSILFAYCDRSRAATEFAAFTSLEAVALLLCAGIGNALADRVGYSPVLAVGAGLSALGAIWAWSRRKEVSAYEGEVI